MNVNRARCRLTVFILGLGLFALFGAAVAAPKKANHHDGKQLRGGA